MLHLQFEHENHLNCYSLKKEPKRDESLKSIIVDFPKIMERSVEADLLFGITNRFGCMTYDFFVYCIHNQYDSFLS